MEFDDLEGSGCHGVVDLETGELVERFDLLHEDRGIGHVMRTAEDMNEENNCPTKYE